MKIHEVFEPVLCEESTLVKFGDYLAAEFPLDFLPPKVERSPAFISTISLPEKVVGGDYVAVPLYSTNKEEFKLDIKCGETLVAAATDRKIVVFDETATDNVLTVRLVAFLKTVMRRNSGELFTRRRVTDIFIDEKSKIEDLDMDMGININRIDHDLYVILKSFYLEPKFLKGMNGSFADGDKDFCIALDLVTNDSFIRPINNKDQSYGLAVLDNRRILLGSY